MLSCVRIMLRDGMTQDGYACLHACPKNALHMKNERSAVRFRNDHVTLKEIIAANE